MKDKIAAANQCFHALNKMLSKSTKIRTYKTVIRPVILYGCETWTLTRKMALTMKTWERKILRKIYRPKCEQGVWRIRSNLELQNVYKSPDIVTEIKIGRLEWLGNVIRMEDTCIPKMIFNTKPEGRHKISRYKKMETKSSRQK
jgi:hypothetical protein